MQGRILGTIVLAAVMTGGPAATAHATPPGTNGLITWQHEAPDAPPRVWVAAPDGSGVREVFAEEDAAQFEPGFSPADPNTVAFSRDVPRPFAARILIGNLATGETRRLPTGKDAAVAPTFSPDGTRIAYFSIRPPAGKRPPGEPRITVVGVDGKGRKLLTPANRTSFDPDFSPDGRMIAYSERRQAGPFSDDRLMVMNADGSGRHPVTKYGGRREFNPKWLPDGSGLVFESLNRRDLASDIERVAADGTGRRAILATPAFETNPVPSPDGTRIVFTSDRDLRGPTRLGPGTEVYTMKVDGTDIVRLTTNRQPDLFPDWQRLP